MKHAKVISHIKKRQIVEAVLSVLFLLMAVLFITLYFRSKAIEQVSFGDMQFQNIIYNDNFARAYYICLNASVVSAIVLIVDFVFSKIKTWIGKNKNAT